MSNSSVRIGRLGPILSGKISKDSALIALCSGNFTETEKPLAMLLIQIIASGKEICAMEIFKHSKSQELLGYFVAYLNALDYEEHKEYLR
jgi:hypothetical protein